MNILYTFIFYLIINIIEGQFSAYDQTIIPFSIYNTDGNPNNIITNSKKTFFFFVGKDEFIVE